MGGIFNYLGNSEILGISSHGRTIPMIFAKTWRRSRAAMREIMGPAPLSLIGAKDSPIVAHFSKSGEGVGVASGIGYVYPRSGYEKGSSGESLDFPRFRQDLSAILGRRPPITRALPRP